MFAFFMALAAVGVAGGLLAGLLGVGGGIFFLLILPDALRFQGVAEADLAATIVANSLLGTMVSALAASAQHVRQRTPGVAYIFWVGGAAAVTAFLSLEFIVSQPYFNVAVFNGFVLAVLVVILAQTLFGFFKRNAYTEAEKKISLAKNQTSKLIGAGAGAGLISSLTGLGGGILLVPLLRNWMNFPIREAAFISSGAIVLSNLAALVFSLKATPHQPVLGSMGYLVPAVAIPMILGVVVAAPFGVRLATRLTSRTLTGIYIAFLLLAIGRRIADLIFAN
jgi:uncharacterized membrane protein YfcA